MKPKIAYANDNSRFYVELKSRVDSYFSLSGLPITGEWKILPKAIILLSSWFVIYGLILTFGANYVEVAYLLYFVWGIVFAGIGFNVMHDASHGAFAKNKKLNLAMLLSLELMGASHIFWIIKHVVIHHSYVNTKLDDDIHSSVLIRLSPNQKWGKWHKYQAWYAIPLYCTLHLYWVFFTDFKKYFSRKIHLTLVPKKTFTRWKKFFFWTSKCIYFILIIIIPSLVLGWKTALIGFIILEITIGLLISLVFQLAHVVESSRFTKDVEGKIPHSWAEQQVYETSNFQTDSKALSWFVGGLNFQVEHHLFPNISHVHYPALQPIVMELCEKHNLPYNNQTLLKSLASHFVMLNELGKKPKCA